MSMANWSELPSDVLGYLIGFLPIPDYYRFGAVCQNWYTVARAKYHRPAQQLPWLVLGEDIVTEKRIFFNLSESKHYYMDIPELHGQFVCGSSFGWLFVVDIDLNIRMLNPFTRESYDLPPLDFNDDEVFKREQIDLVRKVILDHDPSESSYFTVMVIGGYYQQIAFWRRGDITWTLPIHHFGALNDIIYFKEKFHAVGYVLSHEIFVVDVGPDSKLILLQHQVPMFGETYKYFVVDKLKGELLLLQWYRKEKELPKVTTNVVVHRLDFEEGTYSECKDINNHAFFIGNNSPVVIDPTQLSGSTQNAIYFTHAFSDLCRIGRNDLETYNIITKSSARYYPFQNLPPLFVVPTWLLPNHKMVQIQQEMLSSCGF